MAMNFFDGLGVWIVGLVLLGAALQVLLQARRPEKRERRKCRRNYGKIVVKARRPVVMLNVRTR